VILLPQPPKCWYYRHVPPCPVWNNALDDKGCVHELGSLQFQGFSLP
jgi:hypothetical protein